MIEQYILGWIIFINFWFCENMKVHFTVGSRHGALVVLPNDWVFIDMGEMEILNTLYYG